MLELAPYVLTGLIVILLVAFCFLCKVDSVLLDKHSPRPIRDTELRHPNVERYTCVTDSNAGPKGQKTERSLNG
jgi:hypothetical protein